MMITVRNEFHDTTARIRASIGDTLTPSQVKRCRRTLCGVEGCTCGGALSERGQQHDDEGRAFDAIAIGSDSVRLEG
jgi:hypothetical protein